MRGMKFREMKFFQCTVSVSDERMMRMRRLICCSDDDQVKQRNETDTVTHPKH